MRRWEGDQSDSEYTPPSSSRTEAALAVALIVLYVFVSALGNFIGS